MMSKFLRKETVLMILRRIKSLSVSIGFKNLSYLTIGQVIAKIISFAIYIYIPIKLGVENYGAFVSVGAYIAIFGVFTFSGLSKVVLREGVKNLQNLSNNFSNYLVIKMAAVAISILLLFASLFFSNVSSVIKMLILFSSLRLIYIGLKDYYSLIFMATEKMKILGFLPIFNALFFALLAFLVLELKGGLTGLVIVQIAVDLLSLGFLMFFGVKHIAFKKPVLSETNLVTLKQAGIFSLISVGVILSTKIDLFMMTYMASEKELGIYGVAEKIIVNIETFRGIIAVAFFPAFIKYFQKPGRKSNQIFNISLVLLILFLAIAFAFAPLLQDLILYFYGELYSESAEIAAILLYYLAFLFAMVPMTNALQAISLEKVVLGYVPFTILFNVVGNVVFYRVFGLVGFSYSTLLVYFFMFFYYFFIGRFYSKRVVK